MPAFGRRLVVAVIAALLLGAVATSRASLEREEREPIPSGLLYLPEGPYLRALAVGQEETLADLLYVWSIQYYSSYEDTARYDYLDQVFRGAITELDPRFTEAYLVGAMIMSLEARRGDLARSLYDKGIEHLPDSWQLQYWAGWESYFEGRFDLARDYWLDASRLPDAPLFFERLAARMLEKSGSPEAALAEYRKLAASAKDEKTRKIALRWIERTEAQIWLNRLDQAVARYREAAGECPQNLETLVHEGFAPGVPVSAAGSKYRYDQESCRVLPPPGISFGKGS